MINLDLICRAKSADSNAFESICTEFDPLFNYHAQRFVYNKYMDMEDMNSLTNLCRVELWNLVKNFEIDATIPEEDNIKKFRNALSVYISNNFNTIVRSYSSYCEKKCRDDCKNFSDLEYNEENYEVIDVTQDLSLNNLIFEENLELLRNELSPDHWKIIQYIQQGYNQGEIAEMLGVSDTAITIWMKETIRPTVLKVLFAA